MAERLDALQASGGDDREMIEYFRRELQRARAMLMDPSRRSEYDEQQRQRRLAELRLYVARTLDDKALAPAVEHVLTARVTAYGLDETDVKNTISDELENLDAARGTGEADEAAVAAADARVLDVMAQVADEQILQAIRGPAGVSAAAPGPAAVAVAAPAAKRETRVVRAPAPEPAAAPAPEPVVEAPAAPPPEAPRKRETAVRKPVAFVKAEAPAEAAPPAASPPPVPKKASTVMRKPVPPPPPKPPSATLPPDEAKWAVQVTELNEKVATLERAKAILTQEVGRTEPARRSARRLLRFVVTILAVALAFVAADLLACFVPGAPLQFHEKTADLRAKLDEQQPSVVIGIAIGSLVVLLGLVWWLAGRQSRVGYMIPCAVLALAGFGAGLFPLGHEEAVERERNDLQARVGDLPAERDRERKRADDLQRKLTDLQAADQKLLAEQKAEFEKKIEDLGRQITAKNEEIRTLTGERDLMKSQIETQAALKQQIAERDRKIGELTDQVKALQTEVADLKKKLERKP
jgi:hypothetical protein